MPSDFSKGEKPEKVAMNHEKGLSESLRWALAQVNPLPHGLNQDCKFCRASFYPNGRVKHESDCPYHKATLRAKGLNPEAKWPGNPDDFEFPDWVCQHCYLHEPGGMGQPTINSQRTEDILTIAT